MLVKSTTTLQTLMFQKQGPGLNRSTSFRICKIFIEGNVYSLLDKIVCFKGKYYTLILS